MYMVKHIGVLLKICAGGSAVYRAVNVDHIFAVYVAAAKSAKYVKVANFMVNV